MRRGKSCVFPDIFREGSAIELSIEEDHGNVQTKSNEIQGILGVQEVDGVNNGLQSTVGTVGIEVNDKATEETENVVSSENEAPVSERAASAFGDSPTIGSPRVQFENIKEEDTPNAQTPEESTGGAQSEDDRKCRRHQKHEHR